MASIAFSAETPSLDGLSTRVIHLARDEAARSLPSRGIWSRLGRWLAGAQVQPNPLANPRLEMLRAFCTMLMTGDNHSEDLARTMLAKRHYTAGQLAVVRHMVAG